MRLARLRQVRELKLLTQQELAEITGIYRVTLSRLESGSAEAQISTVRKLTAALGVDVFALVGAANAKGSPESALAEWESEGGATEQPVDRKRGG